MKRKIIAPIVAWLMFAIGVGTVALIKFSSPHASDAVLIKNFHDHQADFDLLVKMANEDSSVRIIASSFVGLDVKADSSP